jgi:hypothetical protein
MSTETVTYSYTMIDLLCVFSADFDKKPSRFLEWEYLVQN